MALVFTLVFLLLVFLAIGAGIFLGNGLDDYLRQVRQALDNRPAQATRSGWLQEQDRKLARIPLVRDRQE